MKNKKDIDCAYIDYCGLERCEDLDNKEACDQCKYYKFWDSANGECMVGPPIIEKVRKSLFARTTYVYHRIVPWCLKKCWLFEKKDK